MPLAIRFGKRQPGIRRYAGRRRVTRRYSITGKGGMRTACKTPISSCFQRNGQGSMLLNKLTTFPMARFCEMRYCDVFSLAGTTLLASSGTGTSYQMNNIYGPHFAGPGTSHQPYEYDQISPMYRYYQVFEFGWNIEFSNPSSGTCWATASVSSSGDSNYSVSTMLPRNAMERQGGWYATLSPYGERRAVCAGRVKVWELEGLPYKSWLADNDYRALTSAGPALSPLLSMAVGDHAAPVSPSTVTCSVTLYFRVKLWSQVSQSAS